MTSGAAKVLAFGVQLLAFPFALHSFGTDRYADFLALQALLSWTGLCGLGISLSLPKFIAAANVRGDRGEERNLIVTALTLLAVAGLAVLIFLTLLGLFISPSKMVAASPAVQSSELRTAYFVAALLSSLQLITSIEASIRSGYQELYRSNVCAAIASLCFVLPGLSYVATHAVSISIFITIIYGPLICLFTIDLALLFRQRPYLARGPLRLRETATGLASPSSNALAFQAEYALIAYLPTLIVAHMTSSAETAVFGSILQLLVLAAAGLNLLFQPLLSAMANAHSHGDASWIRRNYSRVFLLIWGIGAVALSTSVIAGPYLIQHWLGSSVAISRTLTTSFGIYFVFISQSLFQFYMLSAIGALRGMGRVYLLQGAISLFLGTLLCLFYRGTGMAFGLALGVAATSWIPQLKIRRVIASLDDAVSPPAGLSSR